MAPRHLYDRTNGRAVRLDPTGAGGGESLFCLVHGRDDVAGLVPKDGRTYPPEVGAKIEALVDGPFSHPLIGFPVAVLVETHDPDAVAGFLVPRFEGTSLADLLVPGALADEHRPPLAQRTVEAFQAPESLATVTADNHPGNWLVEQDAAGAALAVRRIDPLSFVFYRTVQHTCAVAHPHYAEPEVQGKDISKLPLGPKADRFALAVLVYEILVGDHPAFYGWAGEPDPAKRIARRLFANVSKLPPDATVRAEVRRAFASLPAPVQGLLRRGLTRDRDERPSPAEWAAALALLAPPPHPHPARAARGSWPDRAWVERHWRALAAGGLVAAAAAIAVPPTEGQGRNTPAPTRSAPLVSSDGSPDPFNDPAPPPDPGAFRVLFQKTQREGRP